LFFLYFHNVVRTIETDFFSKMQFTAFFVLGTRSEALLFFFDKLGVAAFKTILGGKGRKIPEIGPNVR